MIPMIMTGDSGHGRKSVTFNRNRRSRSVGTTGHVQAESAVNLVRNTHADQPDSRSPDFDPSRATDLIETYSAHAESVLGIADAISQALHEFFEYEPDEPHLGVCFDVVRQLLDSALRTLVNPLLSAPPPLGVVAPDAIPPSLATKISAGFETQRENLLRARHLTLATMCVIRSSDIEQGPEVRGTTESLLDMEEAIRHLIEGLDAITPRTPTRPLS